MMLTAITFLRTLSRPLVATALLMFGALAVALAGLAIDPRLVAGAPAWLKPAKFAVSTMIYSLTLAWVFTYLSEWRRTRMFVGWTTAIVFVFEVLVIDIQAWRGTTSHFNTATPLDAVLFSTMGAAILFQTISSVWVAVAVWRQEFADAAIGWAIRLGMAITVVGALSGGLMTRPTAEQLAEARATHAMRTAGSHTVGERGDLRAGHFLGLHALQALPLFAFVLRRHSHGARTTRRTRAVVTAAASYAALFVLLVWQALHGEPALQPATAAVMVLGVLATAMSYFSVPSSRRAFALNS